MRAGTPIHRHWVLVLRDGLIVVDWGDGLFQDIYSGQFLRNIEGLICHTAQNDELEILRRSGQVDHFDTQRVWLINLPERIIRLMD
jgi:hypothetical protein